MTAFVFDGPEAAPCLLLAHGSGAPMDSDFMNAFAGNMAARGVRVARFEFAYMAGRRTGGGKRPPPAAEKLREEFRAAAVQLQADRLFIGGKSLGGRVASLISDELYRTSMIKGLVCLGYPFHPPGKPESLRTAHLQEFSCPALIVQGERDPFGNRTEVAGYALSDAIRLHWAPFGNHDLRPPKRSGFTLEQNWQDAAAAAAAFMREK